MALCAERIHDYWSNTYTYFTKGMNASLAEPLAWLEQQEEWARRKVILVALSAYGLSIRFPWLHHGLDVVESHDIVQLSAGC